MPKIMKAVVLPALSGLPQSRPALPRRKEPIIIALIIGVTLIITIAAITKKLTL
jgi:hypothetical protein